LRRRTAWVVAAFLPVALGSAGVLAPSLGREREAASRLEVQQRALDEAFDLRLDLAGFDPELEERLAAAEAALDARLPDRDLDVDFRERLRSRITAAGGVVIAVERAGHPLVGDEDPYGAAAAFAPLRVTVSVELSPSRLAAVVAALGADERALIVEHAALARSETTFEGLRATFEIAYLRPAPPPQVEVTPTGFDEEEP
jgi:hypothetical protein